MAGRTLARVRGFASQAAKPGFIQRLIYDAPSQNPLSEEFPGVPAATGAAFAPRGVTVSTLANGLRVATKDDGGAVASVGIFAKAGSRYESAPGTAHVLERVAFYTTNDRSTLKLQRDVEETGGAIAARAGREVFAYTGEALRDNLDGVLTALAESLTRPKLWSWEVNEAKAGMGAALDDIARNPKTTLIEGLHAAAFGPTTGLGHSVFASASDLEDVDDAALRAFLGARVNAQNTVVVGTNVKHDVFASAVDKMLVGLPEGVPVTSVTTDAPGVHQPAKASFLGGQTLVRTHEGGVAHVAIGLAAPELTSKQIHALGVLQALLGGTGAHGGAAGAVQLGPRSHSRIGRSVHTESHSFVRSLTSFALPYSDAGLFGIAGSCADHEAGRLVDTIVAFIKDAASLPVSASELTRARKVYKLVYAGEAESRAGARDDIAHQLLLTGRYSPVADVLKTIDGVTAADVQAVAKSLLTASAGKPALAAIGSLNNLPRYDTLAAMLK